MDELPESVLYQGVSVDVLFPDPKPHFGDLFQICGDEHPRFPPTGEFGLDRLADLQFEQVDDYFGVQSLSGEGDDVPVWLFPLVAGEVVEHHSGPFDGVRLAYNVLRNPIRRADHFLRCVREFAALGVDVVYRERELSLGVPPDLARLQSDITAISEHWAASGITVGTSKALRVNF